MMDSTILHIILILFITFPAIIYSKNACPNTRCGNSSLPINYPFKLETNQPTINCYNSINLKCDEGHTVINLPYFGELYIADINYNHRRIGLTDPGNCLARRLMTNFSLSPLAAFSYVNYTFYTCPRDPGIGQFVHIYCLSNSTNATVVTTADSSEEYVEGFGCKPIVSSMIPVSLSSDYNDWAKIGYLELTWDSPPCKHCELINDPKETDESKRKLTKLILGSKVLIPLAVIFTTFFGIACFIRLLKCIAGSTTTDSTATVAPPQATGGGPPRTTSTTPGNEISKVESFSQVAVLGESHENTLVVCSICLEEYNGEDRVRNLGQCGHLFHAECIDLWLQKNTTCPICRTSLSVL